MSMRIRVYAVVAIAIAGAGGCAIGERERYLRAIADAAVATPAKQLSLRPIPETDPVAVVSWTYPGDSLACQPPACALPREVHTERWTWVTLDPEVRALCRTWTLAEPDLGRRLRELLGLRPDPVERVFAVFSVARAGLARPCFPPPGGDQGGSPCALAPAPGAPDGISAFAARQMASSYYADETSPSGAAGYPYTRLGYTYDWGRDARADHYGASEFVVAPGTPITVTGRYTTAEFCRP